MITNTCSQDELLSSEPMIAVMPGTGQSGEEPKRISKLLSFCGTASRFSVSFLSKLRSFGAGGALGATEVAARSESCL